MIQFLKKKYNRLICLLFGHDDHEIWTHNGFVKGTAHIHMPKPLYQKKCSRCNRFYESKKTEQQLKTINTVKSLMKDLK